MNEENGSREADRPEARHRRPTGPSPPPPPEAGQARPGATLVRIDNPDDADLYPPTQTPPRTRARRRSRRGPGTPGS